MKKSDANALDSLREKTKDNMLSENDLDNIVGGTEREAYADIAFLTGIFGPWTFPFHLKRGLFSNGTIVTDPDGWAGLIKNVWAKGGVDYKFSMDKPAEYYVNGKQVSRRYAMHHLMHVTDTYIDLTYEMKY